MENKEIPTAIELSEIKVKSYYDSHQFENALYEEGEYIKWHEVIELMIEFAKLHLSKQAEVIAEKVTLCDRDDDNYDYDAPVISRKSIIQASEKYINNLK